MSSIDRLAVRGIRSFSPFDEEKIDFFRPLTLILGQNGAGKTVSIFSLFWLFLDNHRKFAYDDCRNHATAYDERKNFHSWSEDIKPARNKSFNKTEVQYNQGKTCIRYAEFLTTKQKVEIRI